MSTFDEEQAWQELADLTGIPPEDRIPVSHEVERERLVREIAEGRLAQIKLDRMRGRDLADADDVVFVDYEAGPGSRFQL